MNKHLVLDASEIQDVIDHVSTGCEAGHVHTSAVQVNRTRGWLMGDEATIACAADYAHRRREALTHTPSQAQYRAVAEEEDKW